MNTCYNELSGKQKKADAVLIQDYESLRFDVRSVELGSLPRFELKAKRVSDERIVIGTEGERRSM